MRLPLLAATASCLFLLSCSGAIVTQVLEPAVTEIKEIVSPSPSPANDCLEINFIQSRISRDNLTWLIRLQAGVQGKVVSDRLGEPYCLVSLNPLVMAYPFEPSPSEWILVQFYQEAGVYYYLGYNIDVEQSF